MDQMLVWTLVHREITLKRTNRPALDIYDDAFYPGFLWPIIRLFERPKQRAS